MRIRMRIPMHLPIHAALAIYLCLALPSLCLATPVLRCTCTQGSEAETINFAPTADPYTVAATNFNERFRFKAVVFRETAGIEYVKLYTYYLTRRQAVLLHQASYLSPVVAPAAEPKTLTGEQRLYSPILGAEFQYNCALLEAAS